MPQFVSDLEEMPVAASLQIVSAVPQSSRTRRVRTAEGNEIQQWFDVKIHIRNTSLVVQHIIPHVGGIDYDPAGQVLKIELGAGEIGPELDGWNLHIKQPELMAVQPGEEVELEARIPRIIKELPMPGSGLVIKEIDTSSFKRIEVSVAHADARFAFRPDEPGLQMHRRLAKWGSAVKRSFRTSLPPD